jgi:hypothetical protein
MYIYVCFIGIYVWKYIHTEREIYIYTQRQRHVYKHIYRDDGLFEEVHAQLLELGYIYVHSNALVTRSNTWEHTSNTIATHENTLATH